VTRRLRLWSALFALVCVVVSAVALEVTDEPLEFDKVHGVIGQPVDVNGVLVTVLDVTAGQTLADYSGDPLVRTPGLFVAVDLQITCPGPKDNPAGRVRLHAGERTYQEWQGYAGVGAKAGYQSVSRLLFEIDPADLGSLVLETNKVEIISGYQAHAWIDLQLAGAADRMRAEAADRAVQQKSSSEEPIS